LTVVGRPRSRMGGGQDVNGLANAWLMIVLGQAAPGPEAATAGGGSVLELLVKGGPLMVPIGICSLLALGVIVERLVSLRRGRVIPPKFFDGLKAAMADDDERTKALEYCQANASPVAKVLAAAIKRLHEPIELLEKHIEEAGLRVVFGLRKYLRLLSVIGSISPLLGLLGTIFGMIKAFQTVAVAGEALGKTELLAKGIYEALVTTAAGLLVAIPVWIAYHWISAKVERLVVEMDQMTVEFVEQYAGSGASETAAGSGPRLAESAEEAEEAEEVAEPAFVAS